MKSTKKIHNSTLKMHSKTHTTKISTLTNPETPKMSKTHKTYKYVTEKAGQRECGE